MVVVKLIFSILLGIIGPWMMWRGKKLMDTKMIVWGGILIVLSYFLFSGGGNGSDNLTKAAIQTMMPPDASQTQIP